MPNNDDQDSVADTPLIARARAILAPIERNRQIIALRNAGASDADIATRLGIATAVVAGVARRDAEILTRAPSPLEVIARHILGECSHDDLMNDLLARQYSAGYIPDGTYDGWVRGTWSEIEIAMASGMISNGDFLQLLPLKPDPEIRYR